MPGVKKCPNCKTKNAWLQWGQYTGKDGLTYNYRRKLCFCGYMGPKKRIGAGRYNCKQCGQEIRAYAVPHELVEVRICADCYSKSNKQEGGEQCHS